MRGAVLLLSLCLQAAEPDRSPTQFEAGMTAYRSRDYRVAITELSAFIGKNRVPQGRQREAIAALGLSYYFTEDYEHAIPLLEKASGWSRGNSEFAYALAL